MAWVASAWLTVFGAIAGHVYAEQKAFSGSGDGSSWHDAANWFASGVPSAADAVAINKSGMTVATAIDFAAQSVLVAGKAVSSWEVAPFVYGTVTPPTSSDNALYIRRDGTVVLSGAGTIVLKGSFKNSEEHLATESSVMILLQ
jgi:hypothetical protein